MTDGPQVADATNNAIRQTNRLRGLLKSSVAAITLLIAQSANAVVTVQNGDTLDLSGATQTTDTLELIDGNVVNGTLNASAAFNVRNGTISAFLSGSGQLTKTTGGVVTLSSANSYTGTSNLFAGTLELLSSASLGTGRIRTTFGVLDLATGINVLNEIELRAAGLEINVGAGTATWSGRITQETGVFGFEKTGAGNLRIANAANTFAGPVKVGAGELTIVAMSGFQSGTELVNGSFLTFDMSEGYTYNGVISGSGRVSATGGELMLTAAQTLTDSIFTVNPNAGLLLDSGATLGGNTNRVEVLGGGTLDLGGTTQQIRRIELFGLDALAQNGTLDVTTLVGLYRGTISADLTGTATLRKDIYADAVVLSGNNSYTGTTEINLGTLIVQGGNAIGNVSDVAIALDATLQLDANETIGALSGAGAVNMQGFTLTAGRNAYNSTFDGLLAGTGGLVKAGTGQLTLTGVNTYEGGTTIAGGTLRVEDNLALGTGTVTTTGSVLDYAPGIVLANPIDLNPDGTQLQVLTGSSVQSGVIGEIGGSRPLEKIGEGTLTFSAANTYTGQTTVSAGILRLSGAGRAGNEGSSVTVESGATLDLTDTTQTIGTLTLNGDAFVTGEVFGDVPNAFLNVDAVVATTAAGETADLDVAFASSGTIAKNGAGTLRIGGFPNTGFTGTVEHNAGTLQLIWQEALGSGTVNMNGDTVLSLNNGTGNGQNFFNRINLAAAGAKIDVAENISVQHGDIFGPFGFEKTGGGLLGIAGPTSFTGLTTITGGGVQLREGLPGVYGSLTGPIEIGAAGYFNIVRQDEALNLAGAIGGAGGVSADGIFDFVSGTIVAGKWTLSGNNTYSGGTTVSAGTLRAGSATAFGTGYLNTNNSPLNAPGSIATISLNGFDIAASALSGNGVFDLTGNELTVTGTGGYVNGASFTAGDLTVADGANQSFGGVDLSPVQTLRVDGAVGLEGTGNVAPQAIVLGLNGRLDLEFLDQAEYVVTNIGGAGEIFLDNSLLTIDTPGIDVTLASLISGTGGSLKKTGAGVLELSGTNTFDGGIEVAEGTLRLANNGAAGTGVIRTTGSVIDYAAGAIIGNHIVLDSNTTQLQVLNGIATQAGVISESGGSRPLEKIGTGNLILTAANTYTGLTTVTDGRLQLGNGGALAGNVHVGPSGNAWFDFNQTANYTYSGLLSGGQVSITATGATIEWTGANTHSYTGIGDGTLLLSGAGTLGATTATVGLSGFTSAVLDLGGTTQTIGGLNTFAGWTQSVINGTLNVNDFMFLEQGLFSANLGGTGSLVKNSAATTTLSGNNTYSGPTTINAGTLVLQGGAALDDANEVTVNAGAVLKLDSSEQIGLLQGLGNIHLQTHDLKLGGAGVSTFSGVISGTGGVSKVNNVNGNSLILLGENTYSGLTEINGGDLTLGNGGNSGSIVSDVNLNAAFLQFHRSDDVTYSGSISGSGSLFKAPGGTTILAGVNTFSGLVGINGGTLALAGGNALSDLGTNVEINGTFGGTLELLDDETIGGFSGNPGGTISLQNRTLTFGGANYDAFWNGAITGSSASQLIKVGTGTQVIATHLDHLGSTIINGGEINFNGTAAGSMVVNSGGRLSGTHTINGNLTNLGTLAPGNSPGTTTVLGNYTGGGVLEVEVQFDNAGAPINGVTHDFLNIAGDVLGGTTTVSLLSFPPSLEPAATTGNGIEIVRVGGSSTAGDFTMTSYLLGAYYYNLVYLSNYIGGTVDSFFLQSSLATPGCSVDNNDNACFVDATTNQTTPVDALAGNDTLQLTGAADFSFNVGAIGSTYTNFEVFQKAGTSTVTLTGATSDDNLGFDVQDGVLIAGTNQIGGNARVNIFTPGTLQVASALTVGSIAGSGDIILNSGLTTGGDNTSTLFSGAISGAGEFTKTGLGVLELTSVNTYTGVATVGAGTLRVSGLGTLGAAASDVTVEAHATLDVTDTDQTIDVLSVNANGIGGSNTYISGLSGGLLSIASGVVDTGALDTVWVSANMASSGAWTKTGAGRLAFLYGAGSSGLTVDLNAGVLSLGEAAQFDDRIFAQAITLTGDGTQIEAPSFFGTTGGRSVLSGVISESGGPRGFTKTGPGLLELTGVNTYTGFTMIDSGTLALNGGLAIADSNAFTINGGTLSVLQSETIGSLVGTNPGNVNVAASQTLTTGGNDASTSFTGTFSGAGGLTKTGTGTFTVGDIGLTGLTTVDAGELKINGTTQGAVTVAANGRLSGNTDINGTLTNLGALAPGNSPGTTNVFGDYVGGGTLEVEVQFDNAGAPVNGVTHDFLNITGNVSGSPTTVTLTSFLPSFEPVATTGSGIEVVRVGGTVDVDDFTMTQYLFGDYFYNLAFVDEIYGPDSFYLQSSLATPGCDVTTADDACFIDATTDQLAEIDALTGNDTLQLTGATDFSFDVGAIGTTYTNFEVFQKADTNTVALTGTTTLANLGVDVQNGTLIAGTDQLGAQGALNIFTPGVLQLAGDLTVGGLGGSGTLDLGAFNFTAGGNGASTNFSGILQGSGDFTKTGSGDLTLSGANTKTGLTWILGGTLTVDGGQAINDLSRVILDPAGTLRLLSDETIGSLEGTLVSGGNVDLGAHRLTLGGNNYGTYFTGVISGTGGLTVIGSPFAGISLGAANTFTGDTIVDGSRLSLAGPSGALASDVQLLNGGTFAFQQSADTTYGGAISGDGTVVIENSATATWTGAHTFTGALELLSGTLALAPGAVIGASDLAVDFYGREGPSFAALDLGGTSQSVGSLDMDGGAIANGNLTVAGATDLSRGEISANLGGATAVSKNGSGTFTLSGSNSYTGGTAIFGGTLIAANVDALGDKGDLFVGSLGTLRLDANLTIGNLDGGGAINLQSNRLTLGGDNSGSLYLGDIGGAGGLIKDGTGLLTLSGDNTFSGGVEVLNGGLTFNSGLATGSGAFTMSGGYLQYGAGGTVDNQIVLNAATTEILVASGTAFQTGAITQTGGARALRKTGAGNVFLIGASAYTGATLVDEGTLTASNVSALGVNSAVTIANAATLVLNDSLGIGSLSGGGNIDLVANVLTLGGDDASTTASGVIAGAGGKLIKTGSGMFTLSGANTFTGGIDLLQGGISLANDSAAGTGTIRTFGSVVDFANGVIIATPIDINSNTTQVQVLVGSATQSGLISETGGSRPLEKIGAGNLTLSAANTYTGPTTISAGTLTAANANAFGGSGAVVNLGAAGTLALNNNMTLASISGAGGMNLNANVLTLGGDHANASIGGTIAGAGGKLIKNGSGILTLAGNNTFSGGIDIFGGGISLQTNTAAGTGPITTFGSIIDYANGVNIATPIVLSSNDTQLQQIGGSATQSGAIAELGGSRPLEKIGDGNLTLSGANSFTGIMTITDGALTVAGGSALSDSSPAIIDTAGTLAVAGSETIGALAGSGALNLSSGATLTAGGNNSSTLFSGASSGAGNLTKAGSGTFLLTGANSFSGLLDVQSGSLTVTPSGSLANMSLSVANGASARLGAGALGVDGGGMTGTSMGALTVAPGGTLYLDDDTTLGAASLNLATGSNVGVFLTTNTSVHPQIALTGAANVAGDLDVYLDPITFGGTTATTFTYDNVIAAASRTGTFGAVNLLQTPNNLFSVAALYGANDVDLQVTRSSFASLGGPGGNAGNIGGAIETIFVGGTSNPDVLNLINTIAGASPADILIIYSNVSGSLNAEAEAAGFRTDDPWKQTVAERVNAARAPGCTVAGDSWCLRRYAQAAAPVMSDVQGDPSAFDWLQTGIREDGTTSAWMRAVGAWAESDASVDAPGSTQWTGGVIGGLDRVFDSLLLAGVAGQYLETNVDFDKSTNKSNVKAVQLGGYVSYGGAEAYLNANASVIGSTARSERRLTVGALNYDIDSFLRSWTYTFAAEAGTIVEEDGFRFEPSFALNFQHGQTGDYAESNGGGLGLLVRPEDMLSLRSILTARLSKVVDVGDRKIVPQIKVDWRHEMLDRGQGFDAAFAGAPDVWFKVDGTQIGRDTFTLGAAVTVPIAGRVTGYVDAQSSLNEDVVSGMASVGVRATW